MLPSTVNTMNWMRKRRGCWGSGLAFFGIFACSPFEVPEGPDMDALEEKYDEPKGQLSSEHVEELVDEAREAVDRLQKLGGFQFVTETLKKVHDVLHDTSDQDGDGVLPLKGSAHVRLICPGLESKASTEKGNGSLEFRVAFEDSVVQKVIWGTFDDCQMYAYDTGITLNGTIDISLGKHQPLTDLGLEIILIRLDGDVAFEGKTAPLLHDFRLVGDQIEQRVTTEGGDVIFFFSASLLNKQLGSAGVRTAVGSFCCYFTERACYDLVGDKCDAISSGDTRITW